MKIAVLPSFEDDAAYNRVILIDHGHAVDRLVRLTQSDGAPGYWLNAEPITLNVYSAFEALVLASKQGA